MVCAFALTAIMTLQGLPSQPAPGGPATGSEAVPRDAVLLAMDAFSIIRMLDEKDYEARKAEVAENLCRNLRPFLVGGKAQAVPPAPVSGHAGGGRSVRQAVHGPTRVIGAPPAHVVKPKPPGGMGPKPAGSAYAKVAQKQRIRAKFAAADAPFKKLQAADPAQAAMVAELLKASRAAFAKGQFDASESYVDHALRLLGVEPK
jgi:hypothetical protein